MPDLNYHHLRYFRAVAHDGNLTRTAERLNLSQSALSVQIRQLEERLGHALFERRGRQLHLTEAGRIALDHADAIFSAGEELIATLRQTEAMPESEAFTIEMAEGGRVMSSKDAAEGPRAFLEKRDPVFTGT